MTTTIAADATTKSVTRSETVTLGEWRPFGTWFVRYWSNKEIAAQAWSDHSWGAYAPWVHDGEDVRIIDGSHRGPRSPAATIEQAKEHADAALNKWLLDNAPTEAKEEK